MAANKLISAIDKVVRRDALPFAFFGEDGRVYAEPPEGITFRAKRVEPEELRRLVAESVGSNQTEIPMARTNPAPNLGLIGLIQSIHFGPPELTLSDLDDIDIWINAWRDGSGDYEAWPNVEEQVEAVRHDLNELIGAGAAYEVEYVGTGRGAQKIETDDASQQWLAEAEDGIARIEDAYEYDLEDID